MGHHMKTTDCSTLETMLENHASVDLIDIRSKQKFAAIGFLESPIAARRRACFQVVSL